MKAVSIHPSVTKPPINKEEVINGLKPDDPLAPSILDKELAKHEEKLPEHPSLKEEFQKSAEAGEFKGPYRAYKMPQGNTIYMTPKMYEKLGEEIVLEIGQITAGRNVLISTRQEALDANPDLIDSIKLNSMSPDAFGAQPHESVHPWSPPLSNIAENFLLIPDNYGDNAFENSLGEFWLASEMFNIEPNHQHGMLAYSVFHEAWHINDAVTGSFLQRFLDLDRDGPEILAGETYADNNARESCQKLNYDYEADLAISFRAIRSFSFRRDNIELVDENHATNPISKNSLRSDADSYIEEAREHFGETTKLVEFIDDVEKTIKSTNINYSDASDEIRKKIRESLDPSDDRFKADLERFDIKVTKGSLWAQRELTIDAGQILAERYAITKTLLEQDKISDPEQKAYAECFVNAMEKHTDPTLLHEIQTTLLKEARTTLANSNITELNKQSEDPAQITAAENVQNHEISNPANNPMG